MRFRHGGTALAGLATVSALLVVGLLLPTASAAYATYRAPFSGSTVTSTTSVTSIGTGSNTVLVAPSFSLTTGAVAESIQSYATGAAAGDNFDETAEAGMIGIDWSCVGATCGLPTQVVLTWTLQGGATGVTTCPSGLGVGGAIYADTQIRLEGEVIASPAGNVIGNGNTLEANVVAAACPASMSAPLSGTYVLVISVTPVGPFVGTQTWTIEGYVHLETHAGGTFATTTAPTATATATIGKGSSLTSVVIQ
jgi:hypothetical protein